MSRRLHIGDIVTIEGNFSYSSRSNAHFWRGFTRVVFRDGNKKLVLRCTDEAEVQPPSSFRRFSELKIDNGSLENPNEIGKPEPKLRLKQSRSTELFRFLDPVPLSPWGAGIWFDLSVTRTRSGYRLFDRNSNNDLLYRSARNPLWRRKNIARSPQTVAWLIKQITDERLSFEITNNSKDEALRESPFFASEPGGSGEGWLVNPAKSRLGGDFIGNPRFTVLVEYDGRARSWRTYMGLLVELTKDARVNAGVVRARDDRSVLSRRAELLAGVLSLTCAASHTRAAEAPETWSLDWTGLKSPEDDNYFGFHHIWRELVREYMQGLQSVSSRNHLSFVPSHIRPSSVISSTWNLRFLTEGRRSKRTVLQHIGLSQDSELSLEFALARTTDGAPAKLVATAKANPLPPITTASPSMTARSTKLLSLNFVQSSSSLGELLVGGVLLQIGKLRRDSKLRSSLEVELDPLSVAGLAPTLVAPELRLFFDSVGPQPGQEDPARGFALDEPSYLREASLVLDIQQSARASKTIVRIDERADSDHSRLLELQVRSAEDRWPLASNVVIIDPAPFNVVQVASEQGPNALAKKDDLLAVYRDPPEGPPGWDFISSTGEVHLGLPPQVIGEEMIKGRLVVRKDGSNVPVPFEGQLFDFRLSPPARIDADRTDIDTARAPAPWNLRRLLDRREATVGLAMHGARFELLYGMTTRIGELADGIRESRPDLRVAEQEAFYGRIPFPSAMRDMHDSRKTTGRFRVDYAKRVALWIKGMRRRPAQLPVFRNWALRERLVIDRRVDFAFRSTRQTSSPFRPTEPAIDYDAYSDLPGDDGKRLPLRGGVDLGFESRNIYDAVRQNENKAGAAASQGEVSGLVFGALGGSGAQQALFDEGRTLVISETNDGRVDKLTIVRVGRIAMLWNHARHIIVYERSTRTAPRYSGHQPNEFEGVAALRKVREFIEITQRQRAYPDSSVGLRSGGPLRGSFFETTTIPVKSSWGRDIKDGWIIALHGPLEPEERRFYPKPDVFVEFARAAGKGGGNISQLIKSCERLVFYTSTKEGGGGDPDKWPARADVDFPVTQKPKPPKLPFLPTFEGARKQPDARPFDYGLARFTFDLWPAEEAVDLMHGRGGDGLEARVHNISLARGRPPLQAAGNLEGKLGVPFAQVEAQAEDALRELAQHVGALSQAQGERPLREIKGLRETAGRLLRGLGDEVARVRVALDAEKDSLANIAGKERWKSLQDGANEHSRRAVEKVLADGIKDLREDVLKDVAERLGSSVAGKAEAKARLRTALDVLGVRSRDRLGSLSFVPGQAFEQLSGEIERQRERYRQFLNDVQGRWSRVLDDLEGRFELEDPSSLEAELLRSIEGAMADLRAMINDAERTIKEGLGPLFGDIAVPGGTQGGPVQRITDYLAALSQVFALWVEETIEEDIPPFELGTPNWEKLHHLLDPETRFEALLEEVFRRVEADLKHPFDEVVVAWKRALQDAEAELDGYIKAVGDNLDGLIDADDVDELLRVGAVLLNGLEGNLKKGVTDFADSLIGSRFDDFMGVIQHPNNRWLHDVANPNADVLKILDRNVAESIDVLLRTIEDGALPLNELAKLADDYSRTASASLRNLGERIEEAVADELRDHVEGLEEGALDLVRTLADGPITDTLRCTRDAVGYYFNAAEDILALTNSGALLNDLGEGVLNALGTQMPFDRIRDRFLPQLKDFDLNRLLPDFAGLKLEHLFEGVRIPEDPLAEYDWISMRHGFDRDRLRAWSEVSIDKTFGERMQVFELSPITLQVERPTFRARSRLEVSQGSGSAQSSKGRLSADWIVDLNGEAILTIRDARLLFDSDGGLDFDFRAENLELAPALQFVTDAISNFLSPAEGMTITPVAPGGIKAELTLPVPDIGTGAFTMTGITLYSHFGLNVAGGFEVATGLWLSRPDRPFGLAVLFLGGGGWFGVDVRYRPPEVFETRVSLGISAGAMVALNFGVARGSAGILFTIGLDFYRNWVTGGSGELAVSVGFLVWGEFSILGIASAYLRLVLRIEYRNGTMTGYGRISLRIKICWCFTLDVKSNVQKRFAGGGSNARLPSARATKEQAIRADLKNSDW